MMSSSIQALLSQKSAPPCWQPAGSSSEAERSAQEATPVSGDATPDLSYAWGDDYKHTASEAQQLFNLARVVLFLIGAWTVWMPMFPVLDNFNDIVLWQAVATIDGSAVTAPVTLGKLLFAATILLAGVAGAHNLRSVLELLLFERLKLDTGTRYHGLNTAINKKLAANGIEIPFPQHVVHLASTSD